MNIKENEPLSAYTTFKIGGPARFFCAVSSEGELVEALKFAEGKRIPFFILGGGSNLLVSDRGFDGLVVKMEMKGVIFSGDRVRAAAGEMWDELVAETVRRGLYGLENLSAIPGTVGATAVQNIGAYGAEVSKSIESVRILEVKSGKFLMLPAADCSFAYRDSLFKRQKNRHVVVNVTFRLDSKGKVNIAYKDLKEYFAAKSLGREPTLAQVREAVINIRWGKLPDWKLWGTAGSFFKNPIVPVRKFIELKQKYPDLPGFPEGESLVKIALGWILDKVCGLKGLCLGNACVFENQALVIVAKPGATASEVVDLTNEIRNKVKMRTGLEIEAEVEWVN